MPAEFARSPRTIESEATRRAILDATAWLLAERGEDGVSIREICLAAGVTPPTIYHHFGDKAALVDRVVDECFSEFDSIYEGPAAPEDPVERLRWASDRYLEYGAAHPTHYRLMFLRSHGRPTPAGLASYDRLRRMVRAIDEAGRLADPLEDATAAFWSSVHGVTSLVIAGFWPADAPAIALTRDAMIAQLTRPARKRVKPTKRGARHART